MAEIGAALNVPSRSFLAGNGRDPAQCSTSEGRNGGLHPDFDRFERAEKDVGNQFGRSAGSQIQRRLISVGSIFSGEIRVKVFEVFVASILEGALGLQQSGRTTAKVAVHFLHYTPKR